MRVQAEVELQQKVAAEKALQQQLQAAVLDRESLVCVMEQKAKEADAEAAARQQVSVLLLHYCIAAQVCMAAVTDCDCTAA